MIDFDQINRAALGALPVLLHRWLPDGRRRGREFVARNPTREDHRPGLRRTNSHPLRGGLSWLLPAVPIRLLRH